MTSQEDELLERLQEVDAHEFEQFVADLWERQDWTTRVTKAADDGGIDIIAEQSTPVPQKQAIQVKRYSPSNSVGRPEIQQYASIREEQTDVDTVVLVTTSRFTDQAKEVSKRLNVKLIDGSRLYHLIDALDALELLDSYIDPASDPTKADPAEAKSKISDAVSAETDQIGDPQPIVQLDQDTQPKDVPTVLPELIVLRQEITADFERIRTRLNNAERAFHQQRYFDAVEKYDAVNHNRLALKPKIARYDAGLTNIDNDTSDHLPAPEGYATQLAELFDGVTDRFQEAFHVAERAKGLELLRTELIEQAATVEDHIEEGDRLRQNGEIEAAQSEYERATEALEPARETKTLYEGLITEYDEDVVQSHSGQPEDVSLSELESEITARFEDEDEYRDRANIAETAAGSFDARVLTGNSGELFDQDLIEYLEDDEHPEYIFKPPRLGFSVRSASGGAATPQHDAMESGSCFLVITDQRVLYVAGVANHDETVSIEFDHLSNVQASTDAAAPSLAFDVASGETYRFEGLRDNSADLDAAVEFLSTRS